MWLQRLRVPKRMPTIVADELSRQDIVSHFSLLCIMSIPPAVLCRVCTTGQCSTYNPRCPLQKPNNRMRIDYMCMCMTPPLPDVQEYPLHINIDLQGTYGKVWVGRAM
jgi:hypothetical protein